MIKKFLSRLLNRPRPEAFTAATTSKTTTSETPEWRQELPAPREERRSRSKRPASEAGALREAWGSGSTVEPQSGRSEGTRVDSAGEQPPRRRRRRRRQPGERAVSPALPAFEAVVGVQPRDAQFGTMAVSAPVARALAEMGYAVPTLIQEAVIAPMLAQKDLVGQAQTGTGKTAGFGIPLAELTDGSIDHTQAIVLVPTRELARQVTAELTRIAKYRGIRIVAVFGGAPIARQLAALERGAHVVVGTPGRVIDLLDRSALRIDQVRTVVLDEADQMLDIGFLPDIRRILRATPRGRQTTLFSATVPTMIRRLIYSSLREPTWVRIGEESEPVESVRQRYCEVARRDKLTALLEILRTIDDTEQTLIFRRTQEDVDWLVKALKRQRVVVEAIHGGLPQSQRNAVMQSFREGTLKLLVSTNLTSRGIDVPTVANVINYDIPEQVDEYVHRIGRTARMGRPGTAITFVSEWDLEFFDAIREHVGAENLEEFGLSLYRTEDVAAG